MSVAARKDGGPAPHGEQQHRSTRTEGTETPKTTKMSTEVQVAPTCRQQAVSGPKFVARLTGNGEEWNLCLSRGSLGQKSLACVCEKEQPVPYHNKSCRSRQRRRHMKEQTNSSNSQKVKTSTRANTWTIVAARTATRPSPTPTTSTPKGHPSYVRTRQSGFYRGLRSFVPREPTHRHDTQQAAPAIKTR